MLIEPTTFPLWPEGTVPHAQGTEEDDADVPAVTVYAPSDGKANGASVVICPGGGYAHLAPHEGEPVARWLNTLGVTGIVLRYRLAPRYRHPAMHTDVSRALRFTRAHADNWNLDPARVGVLGFSAGGHLASTISNHFDAGDPNANDPIEYQSSRPDVAILIYPVIDLATNISHSGSRRNLLGEQADDTDLIRQFSNHLHVTDQTPPTYLVHSSDDAGVPVQNSLLYAVALKEANVPFAMQVFEHGGHGYGMGGGQKDITDDILMSWPTQCGLWLKRRGFLNSAA